MQIQFCMMFYYILLFSNDFIIIFKNFFVYSKKKIIGMFMFPTESGKWKNVLFCSKIGSFPISEMLEDVASIIV